MNRKTLTALKGSIRKWEKIVAGTGQNEGPNNCPLCALFFHNDCRGCPVYEKTGMVGCLDTPYTEYARQEVISGDPEKAIKQAERELAFLKRLLPKVKEK